MFPLISYERMNNDYRRPKSISGASTLNHGILGKIDLFSYYGRAFYDNNCARGMHYYNTRTSENKAIAEVKVYKNDSA